MLDVQGVAGGMRVVGVRPTPARVRRAQPAVVARQYGAAADGQPLEQIVPGELFTAVGRELRAASRTAG